MLICGAEKQVFCVFQQMTEDGCIISELTKTEWVSWVISRADWPLIYPCPKYLLFIKSIAEKELGEGVQIKVRKY